jgi:Domain of unknown function (DUF4386)
LDARKRQARVAGFLYLLAVLTGPIGLIYVPSKLIVSGDAVATIDNVRTSQWLLRLGIAGELIPEIIFIFAVLALYRLLKEVGPSQALHMLVLGALIPAPIVFVSVVSELATLILAGGGDFLSVFQRPQLDALAFLFLRVHDEGVMVASIFWGLWLYPFGSLVIRSKFIPKVFGFLLMLAGFAYLEHAFAALLFPQVEPIAWRIAEPLQIGELPIVVWLVIWGARKTPDAPRTGVLEHP